jgi:hypothetical protein
LRSERRASLEPLYLLIIYKCGLDIVVNVLTYLPNPNSEIANRKSIPLVE